LFFFWLRSSCSCQSDEGQQITKRYSHSAVYDDGTLSMFVFGGCTSTSTTFNDLWRLDLTTRTWHRPISGGTYPSPKACSVLVRYEHDNQVKNYQKSSTDAIFCQIVLAKLRLRKFSAVILNTVRVTFFLPRNLELLKNEHSYIFFISGRSTRYSLQSTQEEFTSSFRRLDPSKFVSTASVMEAFQ